MALLLFSWANRAWYYIQLTSKEILIKYQAIFYINKKNIIHHLLIFSWELKASKNKVQQTKPKPLFRGLNTHGSIVTISAKGDYFYDFLFALPKSAYLDAFRKWIHQLKLCISSHGDYFEGMK